MAEFLDEEWDISDDQLQQLEHHAVLSTQQQTARNGAINGTESTHDVAPNRHGKSVTAPGGYLRANSTDLRRIAAGAQSRHAPAPRPEPAIITEEDSFDNPSLDEDGVPLVLEEQPQAYRPQTVRPIDETTERERWRQSRYAQVHGPQPQYHPRPLAGRIPHKAIEEYRQTHPHLAEKYAKAPPQQPQSSSKPRAQEPVQSADNEALQAELEALRKEREALQRELNEVRTELYTSKGETSVVRSKSANEIKIAERQAEVLRKQIQEENLKHQAASRAQEAAYNQIVTDNNFLKHELEDQNRKVQSLLRQAKERTLQERPNDANSTPRKGVTSNLRDGFDDDVMMQMSPGKSPRRRTSKPNTPTKKRKQPSANENDAPALVLRFSGAQADESQDEAPVRDQDGAKRDPQAEQHLRFVQAVFAFRPHNGQDTVVEALTRVQFPKEASRPLSSILLDEASKLAGQTFPRDVLLIFVRLLARCVKEEHYKPVSLLLEVIMYIFDDNPTIIDKEVIEAISPPLQSLVKHNAAKRYLLADRTRMWDADNPKPRLDPDVDTTACLDVFLTIAGLVMDEEALLQLFWKWMQIDTILIMLFPSQQLEDIAIMFDLLSTSIMPTTFGAITSPEDLQARTEMYVIDKVVALLWDPPRHHIKTHLDKIKSTTPIRDRLARRRQREPEPQPAPAPTRLEICHLRLKALDLLIKFGMTSVPHPHEKHIESHHGTNALLNQVKALARLVRFLYDEVSNLYNHYPDTHTLHAQLVNRGTALLHHLLLSPQAISPLSDFNLTKNLSGTLMGSHKFRVVMTRLALGRDAAPGTPEHHALDSGVMEDTREMAREILVEYITPDEATQLAAAFGVVSVEDEEPLEVEDEEEAEAAVMAQVEQ